MAPRPVGWAERLFLGAGSTSDCLVTVEDLTTGILYSAATLWQSHHGVDALDAERLLYGPQPDTDYQMVREQVVLIRGCRVLSRSGNANNHRLITVLRFVSETAAP